MVCRTIPELLEKSVKRYSKNIALWEKRDGQYEGMTYADLGKQVRQFAAGLKSLGVKKGDRIALLSEGRSSWVISELGILYAGAVNVPISVKVEELSDLKFRLVHSGCRIVVVSGRQAGKIRNIKNDLDGIEKIILLESSGRLNDDELLFDEVLTAGISYLKKNKLKFEKYWKSLSGDDPANICYTSGTTADPKGIVLTHRNYTANGEQSSAMFDIPEDYSSLLILPWDHAFAHTAGIFTLLRNGASIASVDLGKSPMETLKNIPVNIREIQPSFILSVPALAKSFRKSIEKGIRDKGDKVWILFEIALKIAYTYNREGYNIGKGPAAIVLKALYFLFDRLLFSKIRESFGGRLEFFVGGGALLDIEMQRFFYAIGIPMFQGYGLTEAAPIISANTPKRHKLGTSGWIVPGLELKIVDEKDNCLSPGMKGEIVVRGENVMSGYWKNVKATKEALRGGWLYTGDLGYIDEDGFLIVLGRTKSLLIAGDGEKYSPEGIEEAITEHSPYISQMMLYNNQRPYTVALVVPDKEALMRYLKPQNLSISAKEGQTAVLKLIESEIEHFRRGGQFPQRWLPSAIAVLPEGFTEQNLMLNSTLKMVRGKITEFYQSRIEFLYTPEGKDIVNNENLTVIGRLED